MRGQVTGADPGDRVEVWFASPGKEKRTTRFVSYTVRSDSGADVLVLAVEDYTGFSTAPGYPAGNGPHYLGYYTAALDANGVGLRRVGLRRGKPHGAGPTRSAEPLRRGHLVLGE